MVKHIILWQLKDELSDAEKAAVKAGIKEGLEGLVGKVPGLLEVHVNINGLPTSNADVMLDTTLENFEALKGYAVHPAHVAVADGSVTRMGHKTTSRPMKKGDIIRVVTPGAGGYGDPKKRPAEKVLKDVIEQKVSIEAAKSEYGVVITTADGIHYEVDETATAALR